MKKHALEWREIKWDDKMHSTNVNAMHNLNRMRKCLSKYLHFTAHFKNGLKCLYNYV